MQTTPLYAVYTNVAESTAHINGWYNCTVSSFWEIFKHLTCSHSMIGVAYMWHIVLNVCCESNVFCVDTGLCIFRRIPVSSWRSISRVTMATWCPSTTTKSPSKQRLVWFECVIVHVDNHKRRLVIYCHYLYLAGRCFQCPPSKVLMSLHLQLA